jgi:hypothetical protein
MQVGGVTLAVLRGPGVSRQPADTGPVGENSAQWEMLTWLCMLAIIPPAPKNVANWQTQFFSGHNSTGTSDLRMKVSLPTVANSPGKLANSICLVGD